MTKTKPIDKALYELEKVADTKGLHLEDVPHYVELCSFLTDLDVFGVSDEPLTKQECLDILCNCIKHVFPSMTTNPVWWFNEKIYKPYYCKEVAE